MELNVPAGLCRIVATPKPYVAMTYNGLIEQKRNSIKHNSSCSVDAAVFFKCLDLETGLLNARVAYQKKWCEIDFSTPAGQREWQIVAPSLEANRESAGQKLELCRGS
jgi:hypothetical protein